jgi:hypothetical protein
MCGCQLSFELAAPKWNVLRGDYFGEEVRGLTCFLENSVASVECLGPHGGVYPDSRKAIAVDESCLVLNYEAPWLREEDG